MPWSRNGLNPHALYPRTSCPCLRNHKLQQCPQVTSVLSEHIQLTLRLHFDLTVLFSFDFPKLEGDKMVANKPSVVNRHPMLLYGTLQL